MSPESTVPETLMAPVASPSVAVPKLRRSEVVVRVEKVPAPPVASVFQKASVP
jgi:hypothetical protein